MDCSPPGSSIHGFSRQEYWNGLPWPSPGDLPHPGIKPTSPAPAGGFCYQWAIWEDSDLRSQVGKSWEYWCLKESIWVLSLVQYLELSVYLRAPYWGKINYNTVPWVPVQTSCSVTLVFNSFSRKSSTSPQFHPKTQSESPSIFCLEYCIRLSVPLKFIFCVNTTIIFSFLSNICNLLRT